MSVLIGMLNDLDHRGEAPQVGPGLLAAMDGVAAISSLRAPHRRPLWRRGALLAGLAAIGACAVLALLRAPALGIADSPAAPPVPVALAAPHPVAPDASVAPPAPAPALPALTATAAPFASDAPLAAAQFDLAAPAVAKAPAPSGAPKNTAVRAPLAKAWVPAPALGARRPGAAASALPTPDPGKFALPVATAIDPAAAAMAATPGPASIGSVIRRSGSANDEAADLARAYELAGRGRTVEAIEVLQRALRDWPRHLESRSALATLLTERGQASEALAVVLDGVAFDAGRFALTAARLQVQAQQPAAALDTLAKVPEAQRDGPYHALVAAVAQRAARPEQAVAEFEAALAAGAPRALWYVGLGSSLEQLERGEAALAAYRLALAQGDASGAAADFARQRVAALGAPAHAPGAVPAPAATQDKQP